MDSNSDTESRTGRMSPEGSAGARATDSEWSMMGEAEVQSVQQKIEILRVLRREQVGELVDIMSPGLNPMLRGRAVNKIRAAIKNGVGYDERADELAAWIADDTLQYLLQSVGVADSFQMGSSPKGKKFVAGLWVDDRKTCVCRQCGMAATVVNVAGSLCNHCGEAHDVDGSEQVGDVVGRSHADSPSPGWTTSAPPPPPPPPPGLFGEVSAQMTAKQVRSIVDEMLDLRGQCATGPPFAQEQVGEAAVGKQGPGSSCEVYHLTEHSGADGVPITSFVGMGAGDGTYAKVLWEKWGRMGLRRSLGALRMPSKDSAQGAECSAFGRSTAAYMATIPPGENYRPEMALLRLIDLIIDASVQWHGDSRQVAVIATSRGRGIGCIAANLIQYCAAGPLPWGAEMSAIMQRAYARGDGSIFGLKERITPGSKYEWVRYTFDAMRHYDDDCVAVCDDGICMVAGLQTSQVQREPSTSEVQELQYGRVSEADPVVMRLWDTMAEITFSHKSPDQTTYWPEYIRKIPGVATQLVDMAEQVVLKGCEYVQQLDLATTSTFAAYRRFGLADCRNWMERVVLGLQQRGSREFADPVLASQAIAGGGANPSGGPWEFEVDFGAGYVDVDSEAKVVRFHRLSAGMSADERGGLSLATELASRLPADNSMVLTQESLLGDHKLRELLRGPRGGIGPEGARGEPGLSPSVGTVCRELVRSHAAQLRGPAGEPGMDGKDGLLAGYTLMQDVIHPGEVPALRVNEASKELVVSAVCSMAQVVAYTAETCASKEAVAGLLHDDPDDPFVTEGQLRQELGAIKRKNGGRQVPTWLPEEDPGYAILPAGVSVADFALKSGVPALPGWIAQEDPGYCVLPEGVSASDLALRSEVEKKQDWLCLETVGRRHPAVAWADVVEHPSTGAAHGRSVLRVLDVDNVSNRVADKVVSRNMQAQVDAMTLASARWSQEERLAYSTLRDGFTDPMSAVLWPMLRRAIAEGGDAAMRVRPGAAMVNKSTAAGLRQFVRECLLDDMKLFGSLLMVAYEHDPMTFSVRVLGLETSAAETYYAGLTVQQLLTVQ